MKYVGAALSVGNARITDLGSAVDATDANRLDAAGGRYIYNGTAAAYELDLDGRDFIQLVGDPTPNANNPGDLVAVKNA